MRELQVLQIGDVHHPDHEGSRAADVKDSAFPSRLRGQVTADRLRGPLRRAAEFNDDSAPLIVICGDLTSRADAVAYGAAVGLLRSVFALGDAGTAPERWHVALGNHDVDREAVANNPGDALAKYHFAAQAWHPDDVLAIDGPRSTITGDSIAGLHVTTMNSCVGSGEYRGVPAPVRAALLDIVRVALGDLAPTRASEEAATGAPSCGDDGRGTDLELVYEQLDTPAFEADHLEAVVQRIRGLPHNQVPIVVAHHNLLPQAEPRIAAYTEMVNGGDARSRLASCGRAVVYLHGHIHTDPVEVVQQYHPGTGMVICVSAPQLVDGFNRLRVQFSESGRRLGLIVETYRCRPGGDVLRVESVRIPLIDPWMDDHPLMAPLLESVASHPEGLRVPQLARVLSLDLEADTRLLQDVVLEAEWLGRIDVENRDDEPKYWQIRRAS